METLLTTKFYIPTPRQPAVARPQLLRQLDTALSVPVTLLAAPAGFGKTTLLSTWIAQSRPPVAWLALEEADNDPIRFWRYVITSVQRLHAHTGAGALATLHAPQAPPLETLLGTWINELTSLLEPFALILDDYHLITNLALHQTLTFLLDHRPTALHLILTSRAEPPLPLSRWRARDQLTEMRAAALRFTHDETRAFLNSVMGLHLADAHVNLLAKRTEGWVAGLQLAALALRGPVDHPDFLANFAGTNRLILDYLVEEVLQQQPEAVQRFLLDTALLERLCAPLCNAVLERADSQAMLEALERANLFLTPLDQARHWYRYHPLFAEALRHRWQQSQAGQGTILARLYRRASAWHEQAGSTAEAVRYALAAEDWPGAATLIEQNIIALQGQGEFANLRSWLDALPQSLVQSRPYLNLAYAWGEVLAAQYAAVEEHVQAAEAALVSRRDAPPNPQDSEILGQIAALRTLVAVFRNETVQASELGQQALGLLSTDNVHIRLRLLYALGIAERANGNSMAAQQALKQANQLSRQANHSLLTVLTLIGLAEIQEVQGELTAAAQTFQQALVAAKLGQAGLLPIASLAYVGLGALGWQRHELVAAEEYLQQGIALSQRGGLAITEAYAWCVLAIIRHLRGDQAGADAASNHGAQLMRQWSHVPPTAQVHLLQARLALLRGDCAAAIGFCPEQGLQVTDGQNEWLAARAIMQARILLAQGKPALPLLDVLGKQAAASGRQGQLLEILTLQAIACQAQGHSAAALTCLEQALTLAEPEGYVHPFIAEGPALAPLLRKVAARGVAVFYVGKLLALLEAAPSTVLSTPAGVMPLVEPLSERELEVLRLLAVGLKNQAIADELVVVLGTVKAHINRIYGKLGVENRVQAIRRARELHLL